MSVALLLRQKLLGEGIKTEYLQFQQSTAEHKNRTYISDRVEALEKYWAKFKQNDQLLREASDLDGGHEYFQKDHFATIEKTVIQYSKELQQLKTTPDDFNPETGTTQQYDQAVGFANPRGSAIPKMRPFSIFEDDEFTWDTNKDNAFPHSGQTKDYAFPHMNQEKGTPVNLETLFKNASMSNIHNSSTTNSEPKNWSEYQQSSAAHLLLSKLEEGIKKWQIATNHKESTSKLRVLRGTVIRNWDIFQTMQEEQIGKKEYNIKPLLELQDVMVPILLQDQADQDTYQTPSRQVLVKSSAKIPKLNLPTFNGDYMKWHSFKQLFMKMIGKKPDLDECEKLAYLKGQLEDEPLRLISTLPLINSSYNTAWNILNERFDNTHVIVAKIFQQLLQREPMKKYSIESMKEVMDEIRGNVDTLINMGFEMNDTINYSLYYIIEARLDRPTLTLYENTLTPSAAPRRYDHLMLFLKQRIQNLSAKP